MCVSAYVRLRAHPELTGERIVGKREREPLRREEAWCESQATYRAASKGFGAPIPWSSSAAARLGSWSES
ncbi:hypothetical protein MVI01_68130 [Myxococcus virescens]|uniref:Uncharacterized protein n=1 Tax=Myxococcus virescens TaxID=83456 RepID=A0A511HRA5_9BACT|nr:hypothetical protein MVI01_68130 [Myxococcus virescens]